MSVVGRNKYGEEVKNKNKTSWCYSQDNIVPLFAVTLILMRNMRKEQYAHILSCQSTQFTQVNLKYIGVTWHKCSSLEASMGQYLAKSDN